MSFRKFLGVLDSAIMPWVYLVAVVAVVTFVGPPLFWFANWWVGWWEQ